jgi:hypothetical protein
MRGERLDPKGPLHIESPPSDAGPLVLGGLADGLGSALVQVELDARGDTHQGVRKRYHVDGPGWVLLRPDQVVAARGGTEDLALLADYVATVIRPAAV